MFGRRQTGRVRGGLKGQEEHLTQGVVANLVKATAPFVTSQTELH